MRSTFINLSLRDGIFTIFYFHAQCLKRKQQIIQRILKNAAKKIKNLICVRKQINYQQSVKYK